MKCLFCASTDLQPLRRMSDREHPVKSFLFCSNGHLLRKTEEDTLIEGAWSFGGWNLQFPGRQTDIAKFDFDAKQWYTISLHALWRYPNSLRDNYLAIYVAQQMLLQKETSASCYAWLSCARSFGKWLDKNIAKMIAQMVKRPPHVFVGYGRSN